MMKVKSQSKEFVRPLRSGSKVQQNMKLPGPPPEKIPKVAHPVEDLSLLKKSVDTSVTNPLEILKVFQGGTPEVIETMKNECSMIYECKVCRNLFRSIANFIIHKRNYCTTKFASTQQSNSNGDALEHSLLVGAVRGTVATSRKTTRRDILSLLDNLQERIPETKSHIFTEIPQTVAAVYNTTHTVPAAYKASILPSMEEESTNCSTVVLGPNGRIIGNTQDGGLTTECKTCGESIRHMESHLSTCNSVFKKCFGCPLCEKYYTSTWVVYRHLRKFHGKNNDQVRKLRSLIRKQELPMETKYKRQTIIMPSTTSSNSDKGWLEELEKNGVDGLYKCYICGKQFERRVALLSHTQACEKRKPGPIIDSKKTPASPREHLNEKPSPAAIQMRVCYKKDGLGDKLTDCRVVATRLSDEDALAALSPKSDNNGSTEVNNKNALFTANAISTEDLSHDETLPNHNDGDTNDSDNEENDSETFQNESEVCRNEGSNINDRDEVRSIEMNGEGEGNNYSDFREDPSQDMFASQTSCNGTSRDCDETVLPSALSVSDEEILRENTITNGFLSSPIHSKQVSDPVVCRSPDKPCNGWKDPEANPMKDSFFSVFVNSRDSNSENAMQNHSLDTSVSNDDEDIEDCDFDSLAVTRIICGSVKPDRIQSGDNVRGEQIDFYTETSEKLTPSVSTELSFDFEVTEQEDFSSDSDSDDDIYDSLDPYVSKTDSVCLICYDKITDTRYASSHVAEHLGLKRFGCGVPSCTVKSFTRLDMVEHVRAVHLLESSSLIRTLEADEMFTEDTSDFLGFDTSKDDMYSSYREFMGVLLNSHGISLEDEDN